MNGKLSLSLEKHLLPRFAVILALLFVLMACSPSTKDYGLISLDANEIVGTVLAEIETNLSKSDETTTGQTTLSTPAATETTQTATENEGSYSITETSLPIVSDIATLPDYDLEENLIQVYQRANPAVVYIIVESTGVSGTGFVYSDEGAIVTNNHVVEGARNFEVVFSNGERKSAKLVGTDVDSDLAVIQVDELPEDVEPLALADPGTIRVGQFVVAIGNPFGEQGSMSLGIVSGLGRSLASQRDTMSGSTYSLPQVIQTDAPINPGNSGGPLLNLDGEVVGVNAAIASTTGANSGVGFSIPVSAMRLVIPSLIETGSYEYPYMGVSFDSEITLDEQSALDLPQTSGAYVVSVTSNGPADKAGLTPADRNTGRGGDLIIAIDDNPINNFADLNSYLVFHTTVGQTIEMTVIRDGETIQFPLTLGSRP
ncbi:MAG: trypsin-like peptidase domain-containing protein [Anaerolineales bacterium]|nr:trypsin-like peptidase domain-containing protein [Anaerolineales bacterium]